MMTLIGVGDVNGFHVAESLGNVSWCNGW